MIAGKISCVKENCGSKLLPHVTICSYFLRKDLQSVH